MQCWRRQLNKGGFDPDYHRLDAQSAAWHEAQGSVRHYLYALKAMGFVLLRKGKAEQALSVLQKLLQLDPYDQVGGSVVLDMAQRVSSTHRVAPADEQLN